MKRPPVHPPEPAYPCCLPALGRFTRCTPHEGLPNSVPGAPRSLPGAPARTRPPGSVSCLTEDSPRGLGRTLGKRVGFTPSRVRISYPPPRPPWGDYAVSTARWTGTLLHKVLERAQPAATGVEGRFEGADHGSYHLHTVLPEASRKDLDFVRAPPVAQAADPAAEILIAYE